MDALVKAALEKVIEAVGNTNSSLAPTRRKEVISKAVYAVDALKSALKTL